MPSPPRVYHRTLCPSGCPSGRALFSRGREDSNLRHRTPTALATAPTRAPSARETERLGSERRRGPGRGSRSSTAAETPTPYHSASGSSALPRATSSPRTERTARLRSVSTRWRSSAPAATESERRAQRSATVPEARARTLASIERDGVEQDGSQGRLFGCSYLQVCRRREQSSVVPWSRGSRDRHIRREGPA
ncbi:MAG: hypothetical protein JWM82_470 [Myxococcales bacterium]|nr:hypothetical protein [Myxococcales bacterium]